MKKQIMNINKSLIWTRSIQDWEHDQDKLKVLKQHIIHLPCLKRIDLLIDDSLKKAPSTATSVIFTSPYSVEVMLKKKWFMNILKVATIYTFGEKTTTVLKKKGFYLESPRHIHCGKDFATYLENTLTRSWPVILPGAKTRAFDLFAYLSRRSFDVHNIDCYEVQYKTCLANGTDLSKKKIDSFGKKTKGVVAFTSPLGAAAFIKTFYSKQDYLKKNLIAATIGKTTYHACHNFFSTTTIAKKPTIESLIKECLMCFRISSH